MEEIITVNGQQYILNTPTTLTQAQRNEVIKKISGTPGCSSCGDNSSRMSTLATSCTTSPIKKGTKKDIPCTIDNASSLTSGYVYKLYTYGSLYATYPTSGTTTLTSYTFPNVPFDTAGTSVAVKLEVTDSCVGNTLGSTNCNLIIQDPVLTTVTVTNPNACKDTIRVSGATCQLGYTCLSQFNEAITCIAPTWSTTAGTGSVTVSTTGLVTGVTAGTATVTATTGGKSGSISVTVLAASCTTPTCGFTIV